MSTHCKISDVTAFLRRLEMNNDRTWFKEHKAEYDVIRQAWEADIERLIMLVSEYDEGCRGLDIKSSVYRIYRDIRFRKDKSPYKNYFSAVIGKGGRHTKISCNYVHFQPGKLMIGGGIWWPERPVLNELRSLIDAEGEHLHLRIGPRLLRLPQQLQPLRAILQRHLPARRHLHGRNARPPHHSHPQKITHTRS